MEATEEAEDALFDMMANRARIPIVVITLLSSLCFSRKLESTELLFGEWDTKIRCTPECFEALFPLRTSTSKTPLRPQKNSWGLLQLPRSFPCKLSIHPNGTFGLEPNLCPHEKLMHSTSFGSDNILPIRGRWRLETNPYCSTDRFFDQLTFTSYPRVQKRVVGDMEATLQSIHLEFKCRLVGHFSAGRLRFNDRNNLARGRLTHGSLQFKYDNEKMQQTKRFRWIHSPRIRRTVAFSGRRLIPNVHHIQEEHIDQSFNY